MKTLYKIHVPMGSSFLVYESDEDPSLHQMSEGGGYFHEFIERNDKVLVQVYGACVIEKLK